MHTWWFTEVFTENARKLYDLFDKDINWEVARY